MSSKLSKLIYKQMPSTHKGIGSNGEHCVFYRNRFGIEVIARLDKLDDVKLNKLYKSLVRKGLISDKSSNKSSSRK